MTATKAQQLAEQKLATVLREASGLDIGKMNRSATFVELGFDSLFLIQLSQRLKRKFGVKIAFRQLMEEVSTVDALIAYMTEQENVATPMVSNTEQSGSQTQQSVVVAGSVEAPVSPRARETGPIIQTPPKAPTFVPPNSVKVAPTPPVQMPSLPAATFESSGTNAVSNLPLSGSVLEQIIYQQNQLMMRHLEILCGQPASVANTPALPPYTPSPIPEAVCHEQNVCSVDLSDSSVCDTSPHVVSQSVPQVAVPPVASTSSARSKVFERFGPYKPVRRGNIQGLTEKQHQHLQSFISRYTKRTAKSRKHAQTYRTQFADPRGVAGYRRVWKSMVYQIVVDKSKGSKLWDIDGNEYIDIAMGFGLNLFGQSPDFITQALHRQLDRGVEVGPQSPLAGEVADLLCQFSRKDRATFCNTGSEAVMAALRLARTVTGKTKTVFFNKDYHGNFDQVLMRSQSTEARAGSAPAAPGVPQWYADNTIVLPYGAEESLRIIEENADDIAAVLVEPCQSADPFIQPKEFLVRLREITRERQIALVMDEVITGFRAAQGGAQEWYGVWGDMATYGKILGGGMPIGALAGTKEYMDALDGGDWRYEDESEPDADMTFFAGTFVRHPLAIVAAYEILKKVKEEGPQLQKKLTDRTTHLATTLNRFFEEEQFPIRVAQFTSLFRFMFPPDLEFADMLYFHMLDRGIFTRGWGDNCFLSTAHSDEDIEKVIRAVQESCLEIRAAGFFPEKESAVPQLDPKFDHSHQGSLTDEKKKCGQRLPLTESQLEIWLSSQMGDRATCAFNQPFSVRFSGQVNRSQLTMAIQHVISRHDAFRFRFDKEGKFQEAIADEPIDVACEDLSTLCESEQRKVISQTEVDFAAMPFDLQIGPLVRFKLLKLAEDDHLLVVASHHIISDGWSWGVLLQEFGKVYSGFVQNRSPDLLPAGQYAEYISSAQVAANEAEMKTALSYWTDLYRTLPEPLELPYDRPRPTQKTFAGGTVAYEFKREVYAAAKETAAKHQVSFIAMVYAALNVLLYKLSGQTDLVVTVPQAGQSALGESNLVGHLINLLPVRSQIDPAMSFAHFLKETKSKWFDALDHGQCTLGQILRELPIARDASRLPLVEVNFNFDPELPNDCFVGCQMKVNEIDKQAVNFDLFFNFSEGDSGLRLHVDYNQDIFEPITIQRWAAHFENLLKSIVETPEQSIEQLQVLDEADRMQLLSHWNATRREDFESDLPVHKLFERQAGISPLAEAVVFGKTRLTYQQLNDQANQLAHYLIERGVRPGELVGVYLERSHQMVVCLLAILKSGAAYVPLDPRFPEGRLAMMVEDAALAKIVTQSSLAARPLMAGTEMISLDLLGGELSKCSAANLQIDCAPTNSAYVIYTSGSTGKPKGVQIPHRALTNFLLSMREQPGLKANDTLAAITTLSFDISGLEVYLPLIVGAKLIVVSHDESMDGRSLAELLEQQDVTVMQATPATWRLLLEMDWRGKPNLKALCGGEPLSTTLASSLIKRCSELWNLYGPTETTIWSTLEQVTAERVRSITIGRPIANTEVYVLDHRLQPVPIGVAGRLYIGGAGLALGYLNHPQLNSEKFITHPFRQNEKIYDTGDQARYLSDGRLDYLGRLDGQVKIRGYRIELSEIEHALQQHPDISQAVVIVRTASELGITASVGEPTLVGYLVAKERQPTMTEITDFLRKSLPEYMLPKFFMFMPVLPMTPNRKVDRKALPIPEINVGNLTSRDDRAPQGTLELQLANIWKGALGIKRIGVRQNFFELGGHSLSAARMMFDVERVLGHRVPLATLLQAPTLEQFAELIRQQAWETNWQSLVLLREGGSSPPLFCIHAAGGNVLLYRDLAKRLNTDRPVYGIQSPLLEGTNFPALTVEKIASEYVEEIRKLQPHGPYHLCGYCLGGTIAYEIAQRLRVEGEEVGLLALFDTHSRWFSEPPLVLAYRTYQQISFHIKNVMISGPRGVGAFLKEKLGESRRRFSRKLAVWNSQIAYRLKLREARPLVMLEGIYDKATENYSSKPYEGRMSVFKPKKAYLGYEDPFLGWKDLVENISIIELPVYPAGMLLEPFVAELAGHLDRLLNLADRLSANVDNGP